MGLCESVELLVVELLKIMIEFFTIAIIIFLLVYFIGNRRAKKAETHSNFSKTRILNPPSINKIQEGNSSNLSRQTSQKVNNVEDSHLYKTKGVKEFEIKGMYYRNLKPTEHQGEFYGYVECVSNSHDKYAVGVYNTNSELLGYVPKGNRRLNNSISEWNDGIAPAWGSLHYNDYNDRWDGYVKIVVGFSSEVNSKVKKFHNLKKDLEVLIKNKEKSTENYFLILNTHAEIKSILMELKDVKGLDYQFPPRLIPSISSHLEKQKEWEKLIELENHMDLIAVLSEKFKQSTLRRIEKAKNNID